MTLTTNRYFRCAFGALRTFYDVGKLHRFSGPSKFHHALGVQGSRLSLVLADRLAGEKLESHKSVQRRIAADSGRKALADNLNRHLLGIRAIAVHSGDSESLTFISDENAPGILWPRTQAAGSSEAAIVPPARPGITETEKQKALFYIKEMERLARSTRVSLDHTAFMQMNGGEASASEAEFALNCEFLSYKGASCFQTHYPDNWDEFQSIIRRAFSQGELGKFSKDPVKGLQALKQRLKKSAAIQDGFKPQDEKSFILWPSGYPLQVMIIAEELFPQMGISKVGRDWGQAFYWLNGEKEFDVLYSGLQGLRHGGKKLPKRPSRELLDGLIKGTFYSAREVLTVLDQLLA